MPLDEITAEMNDEDFYKIVERCVTDEPGEVKLGSEEVTQYEQVHLQFNYVGGNIRNYQKKARAGLARKALKEGCLYAVDGDNCQNIVSERREIFVATGLRPKIARSLDSKLSDEEFLRLRMSHIDKDEYLRRMGLNPQDYHTIDIPVAYQAQNPEEDYVEETEKLLANEARKKDGKFVTNMDYTSHDPVARTVSITGTVLIPKTK
ncbi:MAG: hypothetical protein Q8N99_00965 [Nanoarchaeota archaeon]|nr:hypothetical protein [Nanoarchaeota archaeon]